MQVASILLDHNASQTATTKKGFTPLHLASKYGNLKVTRLLLSREAPVDAEGKNGVTPLHVAAHYDHQNVALLLLDQVNISNTYFDLRSTKERVSTKLSTGSGTGMTKRQTQTIQPEIGNFLYYFIV